jgi:hypothetical protein
MKSSGKTREFESGAIRDDGAGKGRCDLLPARGLLALSRHYETGAAKYGENNWMRGQPQHVLVDSALRHLLKYNSGFCDEDHLCAAAWNVLSALDQRERFSDGLLDQKFNDVPMKPA